MLDGTPQKRAKTKNSGAENAINDCVARFLIEERPYRVILIKKQVKSASPLDVREIARFTVSGQVVVIVEDIQPPQELDSETRNMIARLTGRELQIAAMIAQGDATKNVAHKLRISEWTVGTHLRRIFAKLGVDNRAAMVYRCAALIESAPHTEISPRLRTTESRARS